MRDVLLMVMGTEVKQEATTWIDLDYLWIKAYR